MRARRSLGWLSVFCSVALLAACGDDAVPPAQPDGGGGSDASIDASALDAGVDLGARDRFGWSVAASANGAPLAVAARHEDSAATGIGGDPTSDSDDHIG